jgi:outer membrane protease
MKSLVLATAAIAVAALPVLPPAIAEDITLGDDGITLSGGVGVIGIEGREYVFAGTGSTNVLSLLFLQSVAAVLTTGLEVTLPAQVPSCFRAAFQPASREAPSGGLGEAAGRLRRVRPEVFAQLEGLRLVV